jgi:hypothetical protein
MHAAFFNVQYEYRVAGEPFAAGQNTCIGSINHLFRHSDKYRGYFSDRRCDSGVP